MTAQDPSAALARASLWAGELQAFGQLEEAASARLRETLDQSFGERLDRPDDPLLVVMLCGPTAVGKSSLINALAGAEISPPGFGATTRAAVLYVHEKDDPARLFGYSAALAGYENGDTELVRHRRDELLHKVLIDTPDIDSVMLRHRALTARLVHAADLVLFVTSPEKYKVMQSGRWVLQQRQQRALAFVLNKWDREALGLQHGRREEVAKDFRAVLAGEGFPDALIFKVSALAGGSGDIQNELPELRAWLESGINRSTAAMIRQRRLRAAWGRLAAGIEEATPQPLSNHKLLPEINERLIGRGGEAGQSLAAEASLLEASGLEDNAWPATPGLLGMSTRLWNRVGSTRASLRSGLAMFSGAVQGRGLETGSLSNQGFGARGAAIWSEAIAEIVAEAAAGGIALGPVAAAWRSETAQLERQLPLLPLDVAAELMAQASRPTLRRVAGIAAAYAVEALIILVLLVTVWRVGADFVAGVYASANLVFTVAALIAMLVIIGHTLAAMFFPPLRQRLRRIVAQRAKALAAAAAQRAATALRDHVAAVDRLAGEGRDLLLRIDRAVAALASGSSAGGEGNQASVDRLFGQEPPLRLTAEATLPPAMNQGGQVAYKEEQQRTARQEERPAVRRPVFD